MRIETIFKVDDLMVEKLEYDHRVEYRISQQGYAFTQLERPVLTVSNIFKLLCEYKEERRQGLSKEAEYELEDYLK